MKNLEAEQQKMRERNRAAKQSKPVAGSATSYEACEVSELKALQKRVMALESENKGLRIQIAALHRQAPAQQTSPKNYWVDSFVCLFAGYGWQAISRARNIE